MNSPWTTAEQVFAASHVMGSVVTCNGPGPAKSPLSAHDTLRKD